MSQIYIASLLLELTETIQTAFTVTRCNLDLEIQHFVPLEIPIMGQFSPSEALYLHLLPVVLQVVVSVSEPFGSQMPLFAPNRNAMFPVLIRTLKLYPKRYQSTFLLSAPFFSHRHHSIYFCFMNYSISQFLLLLVASDQKSTKKLSSIKSSL